MAQEFPTPASTSTSLKTYNFSSSKHGLCSVSTLIVGKSDAVLVDPPLIISDAKDLVKWIKSTTDNNLTAIFVTHHHPDHYWSANIILESYTSAKFYAAPYVLEDILVEYDTKAPSIHKLLGNKATMWPAKPEPYPWSFFVLDGNNSSPIVLLGPVQGDCMNCTLFWLPKESTVICGDVLFGRDAHVWCEEIESPQIYQAWWNTLALIESLQPAKLVPGHISGDRTLDAATDLEHTRNYLAFFKETILDRSDKLTKADIVAIFKQAYPQCMDVNGAFFLEALSNHFAKENFLETGEPADPFMVLLRLNRIHKSGSKSKAELEGFRL